MITKAWRLLRIGGYDTLFCLLCDKYSANPTDIAETFCGYCKTFLREVPMDYARPDDEKIPQHDPLGPRKGFTAYPMESGGLLILRNKPPRRSTP